MSVSGISPRPTLDVAVTLLASADLPIADLTEAHCEHFFYCGPALAPNGLVGVELLGDNALLRSLVVMPERRSAGIGTLLVEHAESYARTRGVRVVYLLTTTAEVFFLRLGYARAERERAPPAIKATREFADICPASSAFMSKQL